MVVPTDFTVQHADGSGVTHVQAITLKDPITHNADYQFNTDASGNVRKVIETKQYNAYVNGHLERLIGVSAPFQHFTFATSAAI